MTIPIWKPASLIFMQHHPFVPQRNRLLLAAACLLVPFTAIRAEEPPLRDLLRDGLYAEEVTRDPEAAAKQYEQVLGRYSEQRDFAASALFRLAEVRRKQDRKDDAIQLYQRLLAEFPNAANETKLARENLAAFGGKLPETKDAPTDEETRELTRLQAAATAAPDTLLAPDALNNASFLGWTKVVKFLLAAGNRPYESYGLQHAASAGNLEIIKLLLAAGGPVPEKLATTSIMKAIENKRYTALDFLLKAGLKPGRVEGGFPVLAQTLISDTVSLPAAETLLKNGADIDEMVDPPQLQGDPYGTALGLTVFNGKFESAKWLLEKGAKPDLPDPFYGLTPLHYAALGEHPGTLEMMGKLLDAGADPNHLSLDKEADSDYSKIIRFNATPLESAIASRSMALEKARLLLKHGAKPDRKDSRMSLMLAFAIKNPDPDALELVQLLGEAGFRMDSPVLLNAAIGKNQKIVPLLLKHGANPNMIGEKDPLLKEAARNGNVELVKMLLAAGADLNFQDIGKTIVWDISTAQSVSNQDRLVECLKLLVAAGAKPPETSWVTNGHQQMSPIVRRYLTEQFIIPTLVGGPDIKLAADAGGEIAPLKLASRQEGMEVPDLTTLLWSNQSKVRRVEVDLGTEDYRWSIRRRDADGKIGELKIDFYGSEPFPPLQWGDLVQFEPVGRGKSNYNYRDGLSAKMTWALRKRISFAVTAEIEGRTREIQVRGDRVIFDPTLNEVPLCDAQKLVEWLWQPPAYATKDYLPTILATRKGWPEVRLAYGSKEAGKFQLQAGDRVKLEIPAETRDALVKVRRFTVALQVPGLPFRRDFGIMESGLVPVSVPTLIQAIVETQVPGLGDTWKSWSDRATLDAADLLYAPTVFNNFTLLPHPDLAHIRIRRLQEDGSEKVIEVDLAKVISEASAEITPEAARKADVLLVGGDVVEIPLKKDASAGPWKGFTHEQERFFAKALSGKVQLTDDEGNVSFSEIDYRSPRFIETEVGLLPLPAGSGMPSARGWWATNTDEGQVLRAGVASGEIGTRPASSFLRDGDEYRGGLQRRQPRPRPVPASTPQQPR